ncbi:MAG: sigma 54-interacting transcriptional regulator, partial [Candidatus Riflebacteria bacterium]
MLTSDVSMKMSPKKAMGIILEAIQEVIPYELAVIMSLEPDRQLQVRYCSGILCDEKLHRRIIKIDDREDLIKALSSGKVLLVKETQDPQHLDTYAGIINLPPGHSCMINPLKAEGEIIGLMTLDHRQCNVFTRERVKFAEILSRLLAIALAQSLQNEKLISDNKVLMFERNTLLADMAKVSDSLVGSSEPWRRVLEKIRLVAPTEASVMILGETGTGKEQVAKAIHALSSRADRPFITLNCSVIQANLAES